MALSRGRQGSPWEQWRRHISRQRLQSETAATRLERGRRRLSQRRGAASQTATGGFLAAAASGNKLLSFQLLESNKRVGTAVAPESGKQPERSPHVRFPACPSPYPRIPRPPAEDADRRRVGRRRRRRAHAGLQPGQRRAAVPGAGRRRRGCRTGRAGRPPRLRRLAVEPHAPARAAEPAVAPGRADGARRPGARRAGVPEQRQERRGGAGDGRAAGHRLPALHGRLGDQDRGQHRRRVDAADAR
ncbi:hypothetical protein D3C78_1061110 [compost metagenome]